MAYYYLISSLPMLKADGELPLSYDEFLEACRTSLKVPTCQLLETLTPESKGGPFLSKWAAFYGALNEELLYQRNLRLGRKATPPVNREESVVKMVNAVMSQPHPLAAEELLLSLEFQKLDELVGTHYFDDYVLMGYALKLKLLERKTSFKFREGKAELDTILDKLEREIMSMEQE